jgi:UDP-GlcNAc:undecaprenyl-phosphate GlcNAc-1-phosphate transferase
MFLTSLGIRNKNDVVVRWSNQSKPSLGGVSFYISFLFTAIFYSIFFPNEASIFTNLQFIGLFIAGSLAFAMGLADDAYNTKPLFKLFIQIACGVTFIMSGTIINLTNILVVDSIFTVLWVIIIMNSLNMLDNMDGITGTVVVSLLTLCLISSAWISGEMNLTRIILLIAIIGSLLGFLKLNIHPSKLFMGDAGSQFIGLFVAFFAVEDLWNVGESIGAPSWTGLLITLVAFTPAAADTITVVINRLKKGQSPMVGGKDHTTHHLVYSGMTDKQVWYTFLGISSLSLIFGVIMLYLVSISNYIAIIPFSLFFIITFGLLYRLTKKYTHKEK